MLSSGTSTEVSTTSTGVGCGLGDFVLGVGTGLTAGDGVLLTATDDPALAPAAATHPAATTPTTSANANQPSARPVRARLLAGMEGVDTV